MSDRTRFLSYSTTSKAHQLAMLYLEKRFLSQTPSVELFMDEYDEALEKITERLHRPAPKINPSPGLKL
ncbi:hypothetical protein DMN77_08245 [Paenibacillus sp. 79R4]|uniref:hypothetical protein n=1 Tax=Paenibacillus sp. 79R4 TaxID=2212847 RepID=UPI0015BD7F68|nr:hypothetical protein [Paenibacillus sp. 79R4]NWL87593.1 hypothetical protein [Paenibacillus sp. 79R4]